MRSRAYLEIAARYLPLPETLVTPSRAHKASRSRALVARADALRVERLFFIASLLALLLALLLTSP